MSVLFCFEQKFSFQLSNPGNNVFISPCLPQKAHTPPSELRHQKLLRYLPHSMSGGIFQSFVSVATTPLSLTDGSAVLPATAEKGWVVKEEKKVDLFLTASQLQAGQMTE